MFCFPSIEPIFPRTHDKFLFFGVEKYNLEIKKKLRFYNNFNYAEYVLIDELGDFALYRFKTRVCEQYRDWRRYFTNLSEL